MNLVKLYRAVSVWELADLKQRRQFRPLPSVSSMEGKWFAENPEHAREWGRRFYQGEPFQVVEIEIPVQVADQLFRELNLDRIGPARYADQGQLTMINRTLSIIREFYWNPAGGV